SLQGIHGSGSPIDPSLFPTPINLNQIGPTFDFTPLGGGPTFGIDFSHLNDQPFFKTLSHLFIWNGLGNWYLQPLTWDTGCAPTSPLETVIIRTGKESYAAGYVIGSLTIEFGAILNLTAGTLTVGGLTNAGLIQINSSGVDPALNMSGVITLTGHGTIA